MSTGSDACGDGDSDGGGDGDGNVSIDRQVAIIIAQQG